MSRLIYDYSKSVLERVSFDSKLFYKELEKAVRLLLPYEIEELTVWLVSFIKEKPELNQSLLIVNK
jgi:DNA replication protein DnaD